MIHVMGLCNEWSGLLKFIEIGRGQSEEDIIKLPIMKLNHLLRPVYAEAWTDFLAS